MTTENLTLPGDIPGLLRRGSPVFIACDGYRSGTVHSLEPAYGNVATSWLVSGYGNVATSWLVSGRYECTEQPISDLALDLTDPTGRAHASWHVRDTPELATARIPDDVNVHYWHHVNRLAMCGEPMTHDEIALFRRVVLHVAGRA